MDAPPHGTGLGTGGGEIPKNVVHVIVGCSGYAMESRIHNIAFLAEWEYVRGQQRRGSFDRITNLVYESQFEGVRSDELHFAIENMAEDGELETDMTTVNERLRTVYHLPSDDDSDPPDFKGADTIAEVAQKHRRDTIEELVKHVQRAEPYRNASVNEPIRFGGELETL
jgi:hypothetical protein